MKGNLLDSETRTKGIKSVKNEIRVLAISDIPLEDSSKPLWVVGVVFRGKYWLDGIMRTQIPSERLNATQNLIEMIRASPHYDQIRVIMLSNITLGGRKIIDIEELYEKTLKPIILLMERRLLPEDLLKRQQEKTEKDLVSRALEAVGKSVELSLGERGRWFMLSVGLSSGIAERIVRRTTRDNCEPEALKVVRLISSAFSQMLLE